jgi:hypothetical protein
MAHLKFNGEIVRDGAGFAVKIEIGDVSTQAEAAEIGRFLHDTICHHFESKGATLLQSAQRKPRLIPAH